MYIGSVYIPNPLVLAPMAGVTDLAFRCICRELGAGLTVTEMVSAKALCYQDRKTRGLLKIGGTSRQRTDFWQRPGLHGRGRPDGGGDQRSGSHRHQHGLPGG